MSESMIDFWWIVALGLVALGAGLIHIGLGILASGLLLGAGVVRLEIEQEKNSE